jgi:DNA-binding Xre family transcriptional regulator
MIPPNLNYSIKRIKKIRIFFPFIELKRDLIIFKYLNYDNMKISETVAKRIINICTENKLSINKLAIMSGLTQSTLQSIISGKSKNPKLLTIARICDSLNIELEDFFGDKLFDNLDIEL